MDFVTPLVCGGKRLVPTPIGVGSESREWSEIDQSDRPRYIGPGAPISWGQIDSHLTLLSPIAFLYHAPYLTNGLSGSGTVSNLGETVGGTV